MKIFFSPPLIFFWRKRWAIAPTPPFVSSYFWLKPNDILVENVHWKHKMYLLCVSKIPPDSKILWEPCRQDFKNNDIGSKWVKTQSQQNLYDSEWPGRLDYKSQQQLPKDHPIISRLFSTNQNETITTGDLVREPGSVSHESSLLIGP
jgi:hypothetical protein